jgi:hypothetical protein
VKLFNQIQATNDRTMQAVLTAAQRDTEISREIALLQHELAKSMRKDSISMNTVAIMTMGFLPATSFAVKVPKWLIAFCRVHGCANPTYTPQAIFSMPFFQTHPKFSTTNNVWIWIVSSMVSTVLAFAIYGLIIQKQENRNKDPSQRTKLNPDVAIPLETIVPSKT